MNTQEQKLILIVDDVPENIAIVSAALRGNYKTRAAINGERALELINDRGQMPDLILLDIQMPGISGYEVCRRLKSAPHTAGIPIIFLTALQNDENEERGFEVGAEDYIHKPFNPAIIRARVATQLNLKDARDQLREQNSILEKLVQERTAELVKTQALTIHALASLAEARDNETGNHILRTQYYARHLAQHLRHHARFAPILIEDFVEMIYKSAPLHDIGKVGIPDRILLKPGKLEPQEFEIMKQHTIIGAQAIAKAEEQYGSPNSFLRMAREIAQSHHEKWDGSGYPEGLLGQEIPVSARLMAIADVYDALISKRIYKPPLTHEQAVEIILNGRGKHFDPDMADVFAELQEVFFTISQQFKDERAD